MDAFKFPPDPERRQQLEQELARAALALLEFTGSDGLCLRLPAEGPGELPAWVVAGSADAVRGFALDGPEPRESLDPR